MPDETRPALPPSSPATSPDPHTALQAALGRRRFLGCAALFGVAGPLLVACSGDSEPDGGDPSTSETTGGGTDSGSGQVLVAVDKVPVGGGVILTDIAVAVTQPEPGEFLAFDARCTHQGTIIGAPENGVMTCPLHGSQFDLEGDNLRGPNGGAAGSTADLATIPVKVDVGNVVRA